MLYRDLVTLLGDEVVRQFGPEGPRWRVVGVRWADASPVPADAFVDLDQAMTEGRAWREIAPAEIETEGATLRVDFMGSSKRDQASVHVPVSIDPAECLVEFVSQLQDQVWESESAWGLPLPRCPKHVNYPVVPRVADNEPVWWCDKDGSRTALLPPDLSDSLDALRG